MSLLLFSASPLSANSFLFEPYVGLAKLQIKDKTAGIYDVADGFYLGIKGAYRMSEKYSLGLDYHNGGPFKLGTLMSNVEWNHFMLGAGLGIRYSMVSYWLGYYPNNTYEDRSLGVKYVGTGTKIGIGFAISSKLSCNFELLYSSINKMKLSGFEAPWLDHDISSAHVAIALPIR